MPHSVVIEFDEETRAYTATVPGLPIVVDADSEGEALRLAREAIAMHLEDAGTADADAPRIQVKVVTVDI